MTALSPQRLIVSWFNGVVVTASTLERQLAHKNHVGTFWGSDALDAELADLGAKLSPQGGVLNHLHIQGFPGSGKTRFALELARRAAWAGAVVWFQQADNGAEHVLHELGRPEHAGSPVVVIVDECDAANLDRLGNALATTSDGVRLITIGAPYADTKTDVTTRAIDPLPNKEMAALIEALEPGMPKEQIDFCVRVSGGYIKLAKVVAPAVRLDPPQNPAELLESEQVHLLLDKLLPQVDERDDLLVPAMFQSLGWAKELEAEAETVAVALGLPWKRVKATVASAHETHGIAPMVGRRRYISPKPLANLLAIEALGKWREKLVEMVDAEGFPRAARDAFFRRLAELAGTPEGRQISEAELDRFFELAAFQTVGKARAWSTYSRANPEKAATQLLHALRDAGREAVLSFSDRPRREIVWALERLVWPSSSFRPALMALAELAVAENEGYANNASATLVGCFAVYLGGTSVPYLERLEVLDEVMALGDDYELLGVDALARVAHPYETRMAGGEDQAGVREPEWQPRTVGEEREAREGALTRLVALAKRDAPHLALKLNDIARDSFWALVRIGHYETACRLVRTVAGGQRGAREDLRQSVAQAQEFLADDENAPDVVVDALASLHASLVDDSFDGRLRRYVGGADWTLRAPSAEMRKLAREVLDDPSRLNENAEWLTSGESRSGWFFGQALGEQDSDGALLPQMLEFISGDGDVRFVLGYILERARAQEPSWLVDLVERLRTDSATVVVGFELAWRAGYRPELVEPLIAYVNSQGLDAERTRALTFSPWTKEAPAEVFARIVRTVLDREQGGGPALDLLNGRLFKNAEELPRFEELVVEVCTRSDVLARRRDLDHDWGELAKLIVERHPAALARTIFTAQVTESGWFAEHSHAAQVLARAVENDAGAVWAELRPFLENDELRVYLLIGFPDSAMRSLPEDAVLKWVDADPAKRAAILISVMGADIHTDERLVARLLDRFGHLDRVSSAAYSELVTGTWVGPSSNHWEGEAKVLEGVAARTKLAGLKRWAVGIAADLRKTAEREREREAEEDFSRG